MYRVVTKAMVYKDGTRRRQVDLGPWQPEEERARRWAQYLEATGNYAQVSVQSNGQMPQSSELGAGMGEGTGLFLDGAGN